MNAAQHRRLFRTPRRSPLTTALCRYGRARAGSGWRRRARCYDGRPFSWRGNPVDGLMALSSARNASRAALHFVRAGALRRAVARRRPGEDASRSAQHRRDDVRPGVRVRCGVGRHHRRDLRRDARLRLSGAPGEAHPACARGAAHGRGGGKAYLCKVRKGHLLHARSGVQGRAPRADGRRFRLRDQADPRSDRQVAVGVDARGQAAGRRRGACACNEDAADSTTTRRSPASKSSTVTRCGFASTRRTCVSRTCSRCRTWRRRRARSSRHTARTSARIRSAPGRTCWANTGAATASSSLRIRPIANRATSPPVRCREASQAVAAALKGRLLPLTSRVEVNIIEEGQARWLAFMNRELDFLDILPVEFTEQALDARGNLLPDLAQAGHRARRAAAAEHVVVLFQHGGSGGRRLHAGKDRASPCDRDGLRQRRRDSRAAQRPRSTGQRA